MFLVHIIFVFQQIILLNILQQLGIGNPYEVLVYISPIMIAITAYIYYYFGKTIEIIDNIKTGAQFINDNKHHTKPAFEKLKQLFRNKK